MESNLFNIKYFLAANSTKGFVSRFDQLYNPYEDWFLYIIKGGPGTGKSTLMKNIAQQAIERGIAAEFIYCSSDPNSLDGVIFPSLRVSIADGTAPHTLDPVFPGVADTILNLSDCWNEDILYSFKSKIKEATKKNSLYHKRSKYYLCACKNLIDNMESLIQDSILEEKIDSYCKNLSKKLFKEKLNVEAKESIRFLSGITPNGIVVFEDTLNNVCERIYMLDDEYGLVANMILKNIREEALGSGYDAVVCYCPMQPDTRIECIVIPKLKLGFCVSNSYHKMKKVEAFKTIHCKRFMDSKIIEENKQDIKANKKLTRQLLDEAILKLKEAKSIHDDLEKYYIQSMDFKKVSDIANRVIGDILG